jgi:cysteine desulfurase / selenocysteine lyase
VTDRPIHLQPFDVAATRAQFPILAQPGLVYLDNGATTQKPAAVIDAMDGYYRSTNANIHRAVHRLSQAATDAFESVRGKVQRFINAPSRDEVIFTRGTTEGVNLVASSLGQSFNAGDEIVLTTLEHHSNIVPWQVLAEQRGMKIRVIPIDDSGELRYDAIPALLNERTRMVAFTHTSNALGTMIDAKRIVRLVRQHAPNARTLVDGAQWVGHMPTDVQDLECDFYVFSAHKLFGPTGVGVLWGRRSVLDAMPVYHGGGDMIRTVGFEPGATTFADLPNKFEAGTPDIAGVVGLGAAIDWLESLDRHDLMQHEYDLLEHATARLGAIPGLRIIGTAKTKASIVSFVLEDLDPHTLGTLLDTQGVAVRTGHHCCMPLMDRLGVVGTVRASMSLYSTRDDIDALVRAIERVRPARKSKADATTEVVYAPAGAASPSDAARMLLDDFALFDDWQQKYEYLIELGAKLPRLPASEKNEATRIHGCQATVHLSARRKPGTSDVLEFAAEANADIVQGLIAVVQTLFSGQRVSDIVAFDVDAFLGELGLSSNLALTRRNGLASMLKRIKDLATLIQSSNEKAGAR